VRGFALKLILLCAVNALGLYGVIAAVAVKSWAIAAFLAVALAVVDVCYFSKRMIPAKYLIPGLLFLLVYQVFVILYTGYAAFTNYGDGHNSNKQDAIDAILGRGSERLPDSLSAPVSILERDGELYFLLPSDQAGQALLGSATTPLHLVDDAVFEGSQPTGLPGYTTLEARQILAQQSEIGNLAVPRSENPADGFVRTTDGMNAYTYVSTMAYDPTADTITAADGTIYSDNGQGNYASEAGERLEPGWKVTVGFSNFTSIITNKSLRGPFFGVLVWTFAYAILTVVIAFALGLSMALVLNHPTVKGRRILRALLILPYAFPAFLSAMVWQGLLNSKYGFINQVIFGGADIHWLESPWLARLSVLVVNVWMAYPYMFLVSTGAIQSMPPELEEAARVDGAGWMRVFWSVKLPLLLVSLAPLLISSFSMNFNNFNSIYLLTEGGPLENPTDMAGSTDILISFVYRLAFGGVNRQYGLACAISLLIFIIVAGISAYSYRKTKVLEEMN
jgi:arabinogalactan oligomer/maltooligosaccharide transport system permease protein